MYSSSGDTTPSAPPPHSASESLALCLSLAHTHAPPSAPRVTSVLLSVAPTWRRLDSPRRRHPELERHRPARRAPCLLRRRLPLPLLLRPRRPCGRPRGRRHRRGSRGRLFHPSRGYTSPPRPVISWPAPPPAPRRRSCCIRCICCRLASRVRGRSLPCKRAGERLAERALTLFCRWRHACSARRLGTQAAPLDRHGLLDHHPSRGSAGMLLPLPPCAVVPDVSLASHTHSPRLAYRHSTKV